MDVVIVGAGGHGKVVLDIFRSSNAHNVVGFLDADATLSGSKVMGVEVLGPVNLLLKLRHQRVRGAIVAIGDNRVRASYAKLVGDSGLELVNAIHKDASVSPSTTLGRNIVIAAGAVVCADAKLADSVIANTSCVIEHECQIGIGAHIAPGALLAGRVRVGEGAMVGLGARVLPCLTIGDHATVGAGATVLEDVPSSCTVVGTPARTLRKAG